MTGNAFAGMPGEGARPAGGKVRRPRNPLIWGGVLFAATALAALGLGAAVYLAAQRISDLDFGPDNEVVRLIKREDWDALEAMAAACREEPRRDADGTWRIEDFFAHIGRHADWIDDRIEMQLLLDKAERWEQAYPDSLAAKMVRAELHRQIAWMVRGGGYASTVSDRDWEVFRHHIGLAWEIAEPLTEHPDADAALYALLLNLGVARNIGAERMEALLAAGRAIEPGYEPLYEIFAFDLLPRWHGRHGDAHRFAERILAEEGEAMYAHLATYLLRREPNVVYFMFHPEPLLRGLDALIAQYPEKSRYRWAYLDMLEHYGMRDELVALLKDFPPHYEQYLEDGRAWRAWRRGDGPFPGLAELHRLVLANDLDGIAEAVGNARDIDEVSQGNTPLTQAVEGFRTDAVATLLELGADPDKPDDDGRTALLIAADYGQADVVRLLLEAGADVTAATDDGRTALIIAADRSHADVVRLLLEAGADITAATDDGWTAPHYAARRGSDAVMAVLLGHEDVPVNAVAEGYMTPLLLTIWRRSAVDSMLYQLLLADERVDVNTQAPDSLFTPLHYAMTEQRAPLVPGLLARPELNVNATDSAGRTPLGYAAQQGAETAVALLLEDARTNVNAATFNGRVTPLHFAVEGGHADIVRALLAHPDTDVNARDWMGRTPLHRAAQEGAAAVARLLLEDARTDVNTAQENGNTPLIAAALKEDTEIVALLLERAELDVNASGGNEDRTALHHAAARGFAEVVRALAAHPGIDLEKRTEPGQTALDLAAARDHEEIVLLLQR